MNGKYRYDHRRIKKHHFVGLAVGVCLLLLAGIVSLIILDLQKNSRDSAEGTRRVVSQVVGENATKTTIQEPLYSLQLPSDWKETERIVHETQHSVTWTATKKADNQRSLKIYVDVIPNPFPINRLLPVTSTGSGLTSGDVSENCATFTQGGTLDVAIAIKLKPALARWQGVDFLCNLSDVVDNQVGTSSREGVNQVTLTGANKGAHKYFFLYVDRSIQPDYSLFFDALSSFHAK